MLGAGIGAGLALLGCGEKKGPTGVDFARQADGLCTPQLTELRGLRERIEAAGSSGDPGVVFSRSGALLREGAAITRATFDRIEALERPAEAEERIAAWIAGVRRGAALTDTLAAAFEARDDARIAQLSGRVDALGEASAAAARKLGMRACAERVPE